MDTSRSAAGQGIADNPSWTERLRQANVVLFAAVPLLLLFSRGAADAAVSLIGLSFLVAAAVRRDWQVFRSPILLCLIATWIVLNAVVSPLALESGSSFSRSIPWIRFVLFFGAMVYWAIQTRKDLKIVAFVWAFTLLGVILDGFIQLAVDISLSGQPIAGSRLTGPLDRPNIGMFVARLGIVVAAAWVWLAATRKHPRLLYRKSALLIFALVSVPFILLTGERTASLLTIFAMAAIIALTIVLIPRYRLHGLGGLAGIGAAIALVLLLSERIRERTLDTANTISNLRDSIYGELLSAGWHIWRQNPLSGVGLKNFRQACEALGPELQISGCHPHPHNIYVEWLAEAGGIASLGFLAFVVLFVLMVVRSLKAEGHRRLAGIFLAGGVVLTLSPISISQSFFSNWPAILMWTALAGLAAVAKIIADERSVRR